MAKKNAMSNDDKKSIALELYLETDKSQKEIALIVGCTEKTFTNWKLSGDWELLKQAQTITAKNIITNIYNAAHKESLKEDPNADKMIKYANSIEKLQNKKVTIAQIINVFKDYTIFAFSENPELAKLNNVLQRKYIEFKVNGD